MNSAPRLQVESGKVILAGEWTLAALLPHLQQLESKLASEDMADHLWDLAGVSRMDSAAAVLLWRAWNERWPGRLEISAGHRRVLERVANSPLTSVADVVHPPGVIERIGYLVLTLIANIKGLVVIYGQMLLDLSYLVRHPSEMPWREIAANIYKAGAMALPVTALVGFLIGVTISYLSALQLRSFGADVFIVNILGMGIIRELGPVLTAIMITVRAGSARASGPLSRSVSMA